MADDIENDDQWLYGENAESESTEPPVSTPADELDNGFDESNVAETTETASPPPNDIGDGPPGVEPEEMITNDLQKAPEDVPNENQSEEKQNGETSDNDKEDYDEDSDDDVNVVIGDFKTTPTYSSLNIKRGGLLTTTAKGDKPQIQSGKFSVEEFEQAGLINGIPVSDFNVDSLEDKPWRKPGADITDYFNYGFNEDTWRAYCERQKRMRVNESGTGLLPLNTMAMPRPSGISVISDNSGAMMIPGIPPPKIMQPKENVIQVMTADRREYSRKPPAFPDMTVPPPTFEEFVPEINFNPEPEPFYGGYEPTQDVQWGTEPSPAWQPQEIKTLTPTMPGPNIIAPAMALPNPVPPKSPVVDRSPPTRRSRSRERESSRREPDRSRERDRERSHRRERSRSRSHRHKSRSRSASRSHRSHRKKKSRRHEDSD